MSYQVLVVDDSSVTRKVVKRAVTLSGLSLGEVHEAQDGIEALEVLERHWIDLVFADLNMPRMSGVELIERMAEDRRLESTPVIVVTSDRNELRLSELRRRGVRAHINKPFRPETLRDVVREVLGQFTQGDEHGSRSPS